MKSGGRTSVSAAAVATVVFWAAGAALAAPVISTWDSGTLEGWTFSGVSYGYWEAAPLGGDPGGWARFVDTSSAYTADKLHAPAAYLGDYQPYLDGGWLEWDQNTGKAAAIGPSITLVGPGGRAFYDAPVPGLTWSHVKVLLAPQYWTVSQGTWAGLMANVTDLNVVGDVASGSGTVELGLDNFALAVPEPATLAIVLLGGAALLRRRG